MKIDLDLTSFEIFCELLGKLEKGVILKEEDWTTLFSTPGFKTLIDNEYTSEFFKQNFTLAFNPESRELLESEVKEKRRVLSHLIEIKEKKELLTEKVKYIKQNWKKISGTILTRSLAFLPNVSFDSPAIISIVVFDIDARAYDVIAIDAIFTQELEGFVSLVAHELYHFYRNQLLSYDKSKIEDSDKELVWVLNQIHSEGVADHIDKDYFIYGGVDTPFPASYINFFKKSVATSTEIITSINKAFEKLDSSNGTFSELGKKMKTLVPLAGHPLGYYMVNLILKNSLYKELIEITGDPFSFFQLYNKAVLVDKETLPMFSDNFLEAIVRLKRKYSSK